MLWCAMPCYMGSCMHERQRLTAHQACRYPDERGHPPPPPPSQPRHGSHRSTSPEGSRHSADHDPRDSRARGDYMDRRMPNGDLPPNYRDRYSREGPNDHPRQQYGGHRDGNHAHAYQTGRQLEQLSISTSHAPKVRSMVLDSILLLAWWHS